MAHAARGYRRFSVSPAERRTLIWKLNIVISVLWPFTLKVAIWASRIPVLDRHESADRAGFLTQVMRHPDVKGLRRLTCGFGLPNFSVWHPMKTTSGFLC